MDAILQAETILFDFAVLGSVYAEVVGHMPKPKLGVLNIGSEETKGNETLVHLNKILTANKDKLPYEYIGFVEGTDISAGRVQVVVTDGFTGNIVLTRQRVSLPISFSRSLRLMMQWDSLFLRFRLVSQGR